MIIEILLSIEVSINRLIQISDIQDILIWVTECNTEPVVWNALETLNLSYNSIELVFNLSHSIILSKYRHTIILSNSIISLFFMYIIT